MDNKKFEAALKPLHAEPLLGLPRNPELADLLDRLFPDFEEGADGYPVFAAEDQAHLNALFERCGLRMRVEGNTANVISEAYQFCSIYLGDLLNTAMRRPDSFEYLTRDWPDDWKQYAMSVLRGDKEVAKACARKLMPLAPDTAYPHLLRPHRYDGKPTPLASKSRPDAAAG